MEYKEDQFLQLSGIQHFKFCRRQWALIHIENQWLENTHTVDGEILHERAHDSDIREKRKDLIITRNMKIFSSYLGISGSCDVVEFRRNNTGIPLKGEQGLYVPFPIEYKRGSPRNDSANELQLCAQAMCLEEMLCCDIQQGALYFGEIKRRVLVDLSSELREEVRKMLLEMHDLYRRGYTPKVKTSKACNACSLKDVCVPKLLSNRSVEAYVNRQLEDSQ